MRLASPAERQYAGSCIGTNEWDGLGRCGILGKEQWGLCGRRNVGFAEW